MPKPRRNRSKEALSQHRAELRRAAPGGRARIGASEGVREAMRAERGHLLERLQAAEAREQEERIETEHAQHQDEQRLARMREINAARERAEQLGQPMIAVVADLLEGALRLARTLALAPVRVLHAIRIRAPREA